MSTTPKYKRIIITAFGETKPLRDWVKDPRCMVREVTLRNRIRAGVQPEDAFVDPPSDGRRGYKPYRSLYAFGETKLLKDWLSDDRCVVTDMVLRSRLASGWAVEDALSRGSGSRLVPADRKRAFIDWSSQPVEVASTFGAQPVQTRALIIMRGLLSLGLLPDTVRFCPGCSELKPSSCFGRDVSRKSGAEYYCRTCSSARRKLRRVQ